jgi:hypothetical protein
LPCIAHFEIFFYLLQGETSITTPEMIEEYVKPTETNGTSTQDNDEISTTPLSAVELLKLRQEKIEAKKIMISELVSSILEDPQTNVSW